MWPVINSITLIGWNYSIQTGQNISTNEIKQTYNRSHSWWSGLYLNLTVDSHPCHIISTSITTEEDQQK